MIGMLIVGISLLCVSITNHVALHFKNNKAHACLNYEWNNKS